MRTRTTFGIYFAAVLLTAACQSAAWAQEPTPTADEPVRLAVGDKAPDFELQSLGETTVKLSDRFGPQGHPVVLLFSRAHW